MNHEISQWRGDRDDQQDRARVVQIKSCTVAIVADGMGGESGDKAAEVAIGCVVRSLRTRSAALDGSQRNMSGLLLRAIDAAAEGVRTLRNDLHEPFIGCTIVVALIWRDRVVVANVGDAWAIVRDGDVIMPATIPANHAYFHGPGMANRITSLIPERRIVTIHDMLLVRRSPVVHLGTDGVIPTPQVSFKTTDQLIEAAQALPPGRRDNATVIRVWAD